MREGEITYQRAVLEPETHLPSYAMNILRVTPHTSFLWWARSRTTSKVMVRSPAVLGGRRDAKFQSHHHALRKLQSRLLTHKNSPIGYCTFNLCRKDFWSYISLPSYAFGRLLKQCHSIAKNKNRFYSYILLASWKLLDHLKRPCFQRLRADKLKCHTTHQTYSYFEACWQGGLILYFFLCFW